MEYKTPASLCDYVNYRLVDKGGKKLNEWIHSACFAHLFNYDIPKETKTIEFFHDILKIPYKNEHVERWVKELTELGFPCSVKFTPGLATFSIETSDYEWKLHVLSTLSLLRMLTEGLSTQVPETYFNECDEHPRTDKFKLLQQAHTKTDYIPQGHVVTYRGHGVITKDELFAQFKASGMGINFSGRGTKTHQALQSAWWGQCAKKEP